MHGLLQDLFGPTSSELAEAGYRIEATGVAPDTDEPEPLQARQSNPCALALEPSRAIADFTLFHSGHVWDLEQAVGRCAHDDRARRCQTAAH